MAAACQTEQRKGKRHVAEIMREHQGHAVPSMFRSEGQVVPTIRERVTRNATIYADETPSSDALHGIYNVGRINHSVAFMDEGVCTNRAESFFSRLRRAEIGTHHHISGRFLRAYAGEMAWREDDRHKPNGEQFLMTIAAAGHPVSRKWKEYSQ